MNQKKRDWLTTAKYFLIYLGIVLLSLLALTSGFLLDHFKPFATLLNLPTCNDLLAHLFNEAGIAGLIAAGLGITIERLSAKEFIKLADEQRAALIDQSQTMAAQERRAIKQDVFFNCFGIHLPEEIRNEIKTQILTEALLRRNMSMVYTLKPYVDVQSHSDYVIVECELRYDIVNLTNERKEMTLSYSFRKSPIPALAGQAKFLAVEAHGPSTELDLSGDQIPTRSRQDLISLDCPHRVVIEPGVDNATEIRIHSQNVKHCFGGYSYFTFDYHTCDLELSVVVPSNTLDVYAGVSPGGSPGIWLKKTHRDRSKDGIYNWELKRPLLAFQGVSVGWDPKPLPTNGDPSADSKLTSAQKHKTEAAPADGDPAPQPN